MQEAEVKKGNRISEQKLINFASQILVKLGVSENDAEITSKVLVESDIRGIPSHGVARLKRYVDGLKGGMMIPKPHEKILIKTPTTASIDAGGGLGQPVSKRAMDMCIKQALDMNVAFVTIKNSNHYGIAGYYSMMAIEHNLIGISMTNSDVLAVPTFGRDSILGTNPISFAVPAGKQYPYVLDMATTTIPRGKLEVYNRLDKTLPPGWATDETGTPCGDPGKILENMKTRAGGGLLPLGGAGELNAGYKGYGLMLLVDILSGVLSGALYADNVYPKDAKGKPLPSGIGHFFGAIKIEAFRNLEDFKNDMDDIITKVKESSKATGQDRIYIHGEKEFDAAKENKEHGIPLDSKVVYVLQEIANEFDVPFEL